MVEDRNRYVDLIRVAAIGGVVYGHWLLISVTYAHSRLSGADALDYVPWGRWVTWLFQVMPAFFLVGGYVNAVSWSAHHERGESWTLWVRGRALRLLWPTAVFIAAGTAGVSVARLAGVPAAEVAEAGWLVALQLWFLPVYLLLVALTPALLTAQRRWGLVVPLLMAAAAAVVNIAVAGPHMHAVGYANYLFVWGSVQQWGFAWHDGLLNRRWRPLAMVAAGAALLAILLACAHSKVDMVGSGNTNPPSVALLAYALAQAGLIVAAERAAMRLLSRPAMWRRVQRLNATVMTVYLWHFVPVIVVAIACYPTGVLPQPPIGSAQWWALRPVWFGLLTVVLVPLTMAVMRAERPLLRLPGGVGPLGPWSPAILLAGLAAVMAGLARLAIAGFAPAGRVPALVLAACATGLVAVFCTGHAPVIGGQTRPRPSAAAREAES